MVEGSFRRRGVALGAEVRDRRCALAGVVTLMSTLEAGVVLNPLLAFGGVQGCVARRVDFHSIRRGRRDRGVPSGTVREETEVVVVRRDEVRIFVQVAWESVSHHGAL